MSDISKCYNVNCLLKDLCYRYQAPEELWQSYIEVEGDGTGCIYFWRIENEQK